MRSYISYDELEELGETIVRAYINKTRRYNALCVDIEGLVTDYLGLAASRGNDVVILGAYGCGAFKNPPEVVAKAMKKVVEEFRNYFRIIEFAVYCSPRDEQNYMAFKKVLGELE